MICTFSDGDIFFPSFFLLYLYDLFAVLKMITSICYPDIFVPCCGCAHCVCVCISDLMFYFMQALQIYHYLRKPKPCHIYCIYTCISLLRSKRANKVVAVSKFVHLRECFTPGGIYIYRRT